MAALTAASICLLSACQPPSGESESAASIDTPAAAQLVARYDGHDIVVADVDAHILALPRSERPKAGADLDAWFEQQAREVAMDNLLRADAEENGVANEVEFLGMRNDVEMRIGVGMCMETLHPDAETIEAKDIRAAYEARHEEFTQTERRSVLYIYKRQSPDQSAEVNLAEIESLRLRILGGESFSRLAADNSDSETRHKDGALGWLTPGELPPSLDKLVFSLDEGVPSDPLVTRDGVHMFYVQKILPAGTQALNEVSSILRTSLLAERRKQALTAIERDAIVPTGSLVLDRKAFDEAMKAGDSKIPVLRIAGRQLTAGGLRMLLAQTGALNRKKESSPSGERAWDAYEATRRLGLIVHYCQTKKLIAADQLSQHVGEWQNKAILRLIRQRRLLELAASDEQKMRSFYASNVGQFSSSPKWQLQHLSIPIGPDAARVMAELEKAANSDSPDLEMLASRFAGTVDQWELSDLVGLSRRDDRLAALVSPLAVGQISAPYRTEKALEQVAVVAREAAKAQPFDDVRAAVAGAYLKQYAGEIYQKLASGMLADAHFELVPSGLARLRTIGLPGAEEVTVDELESMIEQL